MVNVVAVILIVVSIVPIWLAQRLSSDSVAGTGAPGTGRGKIRKAKVSSAP